MLNLFRKNGSLKARALAMMLCLSFCITSLPVGAIEINDLRTQEIEAGAAEDVANTLKLKEDLEVDSTITVNGEFTIDLNGYNLTYKGDTGANTSVIRVEKGGRLTLKGDGIVSGGTAVAGAGIYVADGSELMR